jgi:hypothetical protein
MSGSIQTHALNKLFPDILLPQKKLCNFRHLFIYWMFAVLHAKRYSDVHFQNDGRGVGPKKGTQSGTFDLPEYGFKVGQYTFETFYPGKGHSPDNIE